MDDTIEIVVRFTLPTDAKACDLESTTGLSAAAFDHVWAALSSLGAEDIDITNERWA